MEANDAVLAQGFEVVVDLSNVPVEAAGEIVHALRRRVHQALHQLQAARCENALETAGVLKVDDVRYFPPAQRSARSMTSSLWSSNGFDVMWSVEEYWTSSGDSWAWSGEFLLLDGFDLVGESPDVRPEAVESDTFDLTTVVAVVSPDAVDVVRVVLPEYLFVGGVEVLKAVLQPLRELVTRDILGECFTSVSFKKFVIVLEDFRRRHGATCIVCIRQRTLG